jgi:hypothetical protein
MSSNIVHIPIEFNAEWFQSGYFVYVISVKHNNTDTYYYIGQTGDRFHQSARSPFYRLWGHYNPYNQKSGTDAQLFKGILKLLPNNDEVSNRIKVEKAINSKEIEIKADYFKIKDFTEEIGEKEHKQNRLLTENIETILIKKINEISTVLNDTSKIRSSKKPTNEEANKIANEIFEKFAKITGKSD